jgi:hypothetical protein
MNGIISSGPQIHPERQLECIQSVANPRNQENPQVTRITSEPGNSQKLALGSDSRDRVIAACGFRGFLGFKIIAAGPIIAALAGLGVGGAVGGWYPPTASIPVDMWRKRRSSPSCRYRLIAPNPLLELTLYSAPPKSRIIPSSAF